MTNDDMSLNDMRTTLAVNVIGPNLPSAEQRKGDFHVHAETCQAGKRLSRKMNGDYDWFLVVSSVREITTIIYGDFEGFNEDPDSFESGIYVCPCAKSIL